MFFRTYATFEKCLFALHNICDKVILINSVLKFQEFCNFCSLGLPLIAHKYKAKITRVLTLFRYGFNILKMGKNQEIHWRAI